MKTAETYTFLWEKGLGAAPVESWHYNAMQSVIDEPIVRGRRGIEVGSGCGFDTYIMAKNNPSIQFVSMDISDGIYRTRKLTAELKNVYPVQCSALDVSFKDNLFDFAYSFGVLHHTNDPEKGLGEMVRILKKGSPAFLYLYEDHSENLFKYLALKAVTFVRRITVRIPSKTLYALSCIASPFVFVCFTIPAKMLKRFKGTERLAGCMPFNFGTTALALRDDLYDRFGAPIEYRYSREQIYEMFARHGFKDVRVTRLKDTAGWVVWGRKS